MTRPPLLLHPVTLVSLAVLVLNDHWFKQAHPGQLSWVCSDIAGLALVPLLLSGVMAELRRGRDCSTSFALCAGLVVAAAFAAVKLSAAANAIAAPILGGPTVRDPFDLLALPAVLTAFVVLTARARSCSPHKVANSRVPPPVP